jgi:ketosteroid isomerase-like protein
MNRKLLWCLLGLALMVSTAASLAQNNSATEKAVAALEQQWLKWQQASNPDLVAPLLADKIVSTSEEGKVTGKSEVLSDLKSQKWISAEYDALKVNVFGDTAIATGGFKAKGSDASGKTFDLNLRWTDTWVKMPSGKWQCVASHASLAKM